MTDCAFIPPYLLQRIANAANDPRLSRCGEHTLAIDEHLRDRRHVRPPVVVPETHNIRPAGDDAWTIYSANNADSLPGSPVRSANEPPSSDEAVDEAYVGTEATIDLFSSVFSRDSYDGRGAPVTVTVHYERDYANAFWDGRQLVFGDGDGKVFDRFTKPIDVLAHEFTHAVVQYTAGFTYAGQSGALNESLSDVFASMVKQRVLGQSAAEADWLVGAGIFLPSVQGRALRSMSAPGTAYDDPVLGKDPQAASMAGYVETAEDNGGVHLNSGIPNRAFQLAAVALGGNSWEQAGPIWYAALVSGIGASTDFGTFAAATIDSARIVSTETENAVRQAWETVGVTAAAPTDQAPAGQTQTGSGPSTREGVVRVRRSGGFAGLTESGEVDLASDPRAPRVIALLARIDITHMRSATPQPDRFVYDFELPGAEVTVPEQELTTELSLLAQVVLYSSD